MSPEAQKIRDIFVEAVKVPPDQWEAFLKEACAGDEGLRRQVSDLLQEHQQAGSFLDRPAVPLQATGDLDPSVNSAVPGSGAVRGSPDPGAVRGSPDPAPAAQESPGTTIGPYKLLELIGEGGMGAVWMAEQREPVRRVALKIIKAGMDTRQVVARFEAERQALALMDHANIAKVFDGGTTAGGRPYFVMELVKGVPITKYCDEHRLTPRERLELFVPVCQAIQHAHQKGIIHRDVKPANVLVAPYDGRPIPKVIDFGVAKATGQQLTERTLFTAFGAVVGTLEYMSPEQAELNNQDIDTRSDIYALGVLLYELLTGTTPLSHERLKQAAFTEMLRLIREEEPPKPSTRLSELSRVGSAHHASPNGGQSPPYNSSLASVSAQRHMEPAKLTKLVRGELDWIVMKALDKDRNRRYETANGLATDVQHYLADEPVQACPPTVGYRLRKFVRRNKGPMVAVGLVLLALVAGIIGTTWGLIRAEWAREDAVAAQLAEAERAAGETRAKDEAQKAFEAEKKARDAEINQRLRAEGNAKLAIAVLNDLIKNPEQEKRARESLENGLRYYEQLAQSNPTDWAARRERAKAYANVGLLQLNLKNYVESEKAYRQAIHLMEELAAERPQDFDNRFDLAYTYYWLYQTYYNTGRFEAAEEATRQAIVLFEKLAAAFADRWALVQEHRAYRHRNLGQLLVQSAKPQEAEQAFQQCLTIWSELATAYPNGAGYRNALAYDYGLLGNLYHQTGLLSKAGAAWREAEALWDKLAAEFPGELSYQSELAHLDWKLAGLLKGTAKPKEAEEAYRRALRRFEKLTAAYPGQPFYPHEQAYSYWLLATLLKDTGRAQEAEKAYRQALPILEKLVADFPNNAEYRARLSSNFAALGENLLQQGQHAEAAKVAEKMARAFAKDANWHESAALVLVRYMALASKDDKLSEPDRTAVAQAYADRARALLQQAAERGRDTPIAQSLREALRLPRDDPQAHFLVGNALHHYGQYAGAEAEFREALRLRPDFPEARANLARARWHLGSKAEVEAECREVLRLRPGDPGVYFTLGLVLGWGERKPVAAVRFYAEAFAAHPKLADDRRFRNRYNAACAAALAGRGWGEDAAGLDDTERARLRRQALDWLRADLAAWDQLLEKEPDQARARVQKMLLYWQWDGDFAGVRGDALAKLPEAERLAWQQLWADVEQTLKRVSARPD